MVVVILPGTSFLYLFSFIGKLHVFAIVKQTTNSIKFAHFSVLSPISAFYPHFSVLSPFQRFIPISAFYPHFSVLSPFQFPLSVSVSAIPFQRFIPTPKKRGLINNSNHKYGWPFVFAWKFLYILKVNLANCVTEHLTQVNTTAKILKYCEKRVNLEETQVATNVL